ncbi:mitochondrial import inner membrane translocase subunit Tim21 [Episyrphus balteatus]|uniref:mitochondrial import inner membrane translocase subunit Tim21 n=1 Tax=Episyrphus balteatus TaxID=286459 RepID=UPI002485A5B7|nr:mitochondrial import inner membrane translocase subunit Tim21 [Episyrphus balteatus]
MSQLAVLRHISVQCKRLIGPSAIASKHQQRFYSQPQEKPTGSLAKSSDRTDVSTDVRPLGEKIKENTKTASYMGVILLGVGVTGALFYTVFKELFSSSSPNNIYSKALERVKEEPRVQDSLGAPIKGFGEESRRGRRQHVAHSKFERNGVPHIRMQFYIQGIRNKATVHLEMKETSGDYTYRYLFVQLDHYPHTTIILEDNRLSDKQALGSNMELVQ